MRRSARAVLRARISVIIPVTPKASARRALASLASDIGLPVEIIEIEGRQPARQRNLAAQQASGEYLYFLDHDSQPDPGTVRKLLAAFTDKRVGAAGGPNPGMGLRTPLTMASELVLGSRLGSLTVWRRYRQDGTGMREAGEESLILCNLMVRRDLFLEMGGFDPRLYPNEENEFLNRLRASGKKAIYVSDARVRKPRAGGLVGFLRENFRYARGRMEQVWINPSLSDAPYLCALCGVFLLAWASYVAPDLAGAVFGGYLFAAMAESVRLASGASFRGHGIGVGGLGMLAAVLMCLRHTTYAAGLAYGALTGWRKRRLHLSTENYYIRKSRLSGSRMLTIESFRERIGPPAVHGVGAGAR